MQTIDLVDVLGRRGIRPAQAAMYLDTCPAIHASVWVRAGKHYRGSHLEGYAVVVLDKGRERGAFMPEGKTQTLSCLAHHCVPARPLPLSQKCKDWRTCAAWLLHVACIFVRTYCPSVKVSICGIWGVQSTALILYAIPLTANCHSMCMHAVACCECHIPQLCSSSSSSCHVCLTQGDCTGMSGLQTGSVIAAQNALGYWISWAPDDSLLRACTRQRPRRLVTPGGVFRRVSTTFANYGEVGASVFKSTSVVREHVGS